MTSSAGFPPSFLDFFWRGQETSLTEKNELLLTTMPATMAVPLDAATATISADRSAHVISEALSQVIIEARLLGAVISAPGIQHLPHGDGQFPPAAVRLAFGQLVRTIEHVANDLTSGGVHERIALDPRAILEPALVALEETEPTVRENHNRKVIRSQQLSNLDVGEKLHLFIDECRDLKGAANAEDPSPYVEAEFVLVSANGKEGAVLHTCRTAHLAKTFEPKWDESFTINLLPLAHTRLKLTVRNADHANAFWGRSVNGLANAQLPLIVQRKSLQPELDAEGKVVGSACGEISFRLYKGKHKPRPGNIAAVAADAREAAARQAARGKEEDEEARTDHDFEVKSARVHAAWLLVCGGRLAEFRAHLQQKDAWRNAVRGRVKRRRYWRRAQVLKRTLLWTSTSTSRVKPLQTGDGVEGTSPAKAAAALETKTPLVEDKVADAAGRAGPPTIAGSQRVVRREKQAWAEMEARIARLSAEKDALQGKHDVMAEENSSLKRERDAMAEENSTLKACD